MTETWINLALDRIWSKTNISMRGTLDTREKRGGATFWFNNYTRGNGPIFSIHPFGLKRHRISMRFGAYSAPCIEHIQRRAQPEHYAYANAMIKQLSNRNELDLHGLAQGFSSASLSVKSEIVVIRRVDSQSELSIWLESIDRLLIPLVVTMAELIGYETPEDKHSYGGDESPSAAGGPEGEKYLALTLKRERNPRNRLLCLMIHGHKCGVCEDEPHERYGEDIGHILEVHHIEPLSELNAPKVFDPQKDLIPLCPNCHRAIHKRSPAYTPEELKRLIKENERSFE